jgi:hypothetical protein
VTIHVTIHGLDASYSMIAGYGIYESESSTRRGAGAEISASGSSANRWRFLESAPRRLGYYEQAAKVAMPMQEGINVMQTTVHLQTTVLPGNRVEFSAPELPEGAQVEVTVIVPDRPRPRISMLEFVKTLPPGPRAFDTWEEYERFLQEEKDSWDR